MSPTRPPTPDDWDAASRAYAARVAPRMMQTYGDALVERLQVTPETEAIEVAAGSGALTVHLAPRVKSLLATDFAPKMLEVLGERLEASGATNVTLQVMDGQALTVEDSTYDRAACSFALMLFPDRAKGFSELRRVLRPGGRAVVSAWAGPDEFEAFGLFIGAVRAAYPDLPPPPAPPPVFSLADPAGFKAEMEAAGFTDVDVELVSRDLELDGLDDVWGLLSTGAPPVQALFDRVGPDGPDRIRAALTRIVEERFGSGPIRVTNVATLGSGVRAS
jgi:SAM-dependent methyltransferase